MLYFIMIKTAEQSLTSSEELRIKLSLLEEENRYLKEQLGWFKRQVFGQKSERFIDQLSVNELLPGLESSLNELKVEEIIVPPHKRRKKKGGKNQFKLDIPDDLPRETEYKDIPEEKKVDPATGEKLVKVGEDKIEKLAYKEASYYVKEIIYPKYASKKNSLFGVIQQSADECIIEGSKFDSSFMAHIAVEKFAYHMPLYRVREKLSCCRIKISEQTLCGLMINIGLKVQPLIDAMKIELFNQKVIFTDDTPVKLIVNGNGKTKEARVWGYFGGKPNAPPYHIYQFSSDRCEIHSMSFFKGFKGIFHADAYSAYEKIDESDDYDMKWAACWAHARRKFEEAESIAPEFRLNMLRLIRYLFMFERVALVTTPEERLRIRAEKETPIVDKIYKMMKEKVKDSTLLPSSKMATAIGYMLSREKNFKLYLANPDAKMDNNIAENGVRKLVIGRKAWLFIGSKRSGKAMANILSLVQTCRAIKINPQDYLEDIFCKLPSYPHKNLSELLPDKWSEK